MLRYRGFDLIEYAVVRPLGKPGGVAVHDELMGTVADCHDIEAAKRWIDEWIDRANCMLEKVL